MPWTVIREDFEGNQLSERIEFRPSAIEAFNAPGFILLKYIDPYDDTSFNGLMCRDLIKDFYELIKMQPQDQQQINNIIKLAKECTDDPHTYLKFYGD
jgi:hypothetical protein